MTFLAPVWLALAAVASVAAVAIHLIAWRLPRTVELPTARFVPDEPARRAARTMRLADVALLAIRVGILLTAGVALARPVMHATPSGRATVIAIDGSASADASALLDSVRAIARDGATALVVFDTAAQVASDEADVARWSSARRVPEASLSVGLIAATREAKRLSRDYESVDIVIVSPFTVESFDDATRGIRGTWPDSLRVVRVPAATILPQANSIEIPDAEDDPILAGIRLARSNGLIRGASRVIRDSPTAQDSLRADSGRVLVIWPRLPATTGDRVDAVHANGYTAIGHFIPRPVSASGHVAARWANGTVAAQEVTHGTGCIRTIGFDVPDAGDFVLTPAFQRIVSELLAPCHGKDEIRVASDSLVNALVTPLPDSKPAGFADERDAPDRLAAIILILAISLSMIEMFVRRRFSGVAA
jgi:hypothetical protein